MHWFNMKRILYTNTHRNCPFNCEYCFAKFSQYQKKQVQDIDSINITSSQTSVLYPACDYDLFAFSNAAKTIEEIYIEGHSISVSTKAYITNTEISRLSILNNKIRSNNDILKIAVSISSKTLLNKIENGTTGFEKRIENLKRLQSAGISTGLTLKPLLKEIPIDEYLSIIDSCKPYVKGIVIGDLYLDSATTLKDHQKKPISWLDNNPSWFYEDMTSYINTITKYCKKQSVPCFESDISFIDFLKRGQK